MIAVADKLFCITFIISPSFTVLLEFFCWFLNSISKGHILLRAFLANLVFLPFYN